MQALLLYSNKLFSLLILCYISIIQVCIPPNVLVDSEDDNDGVEVEEQQQRAASAMPAFVRLLASFILLWQAFFHVSDAAIGTLITFFHHFFVILFLADGSSVVLQRLKDFWPKTKAALYKVFGIRRDGFTQFVVCPTCHSIYNLDDCIVSCGNRKVSKVCEFRAYPRHPHRSRRAACGTTLLRTVKTRHGTFLRPRKVYCYRSILLHLQEQFSRPGFVNLCERWRNRPSSAYLGDVYDGRVWKLFDNVNGKPFLAEPHNLMLSMNVDWFRPYTHTNDSVGAIYMVIQNLPRDVRFKPENVILCGIIPGPKEPQYMMNTYLAPIVIELLKLWEGVNVKLPDGKTVTCRAALTCCASDLPATRKLLGFASYNSSHGCSKCLEFFPYNRDADKCDYSNFDWQNWKPRDLTQHHAACEQYLSARTKAAQVKAVSDNGVRYCVLSKLPYFDPIRFHVIDPMHNLLLGTAKHIVATWIEKKILTDCHLTRIAEVIEKIKSPADVGRVPSKIGATFAGFTADQWRNWTTIFSCVALREVLPGEHLRCWMLFVKACQLLCSRVIRLEDIDAAHSYLCQFCIISKSLYGKEFCNANLHMHLHLKECLLDFGPVYSFWCFSFERYNGILGSYQTNNNMIEPQIMGKFLRDQQIRFLQLDDGYPKVCELLKQMSCTTGSLAHAPISAEALMRFMHLRHAPLKDNLDFCHRDEDGIVVLPPVMEHVLSSQEQAHLRALIGKLHPNNELPYITQVCRKSSRVSLLGEVFGSKLCKSDRSSYVVAYWPRFDSECSFTCLPSSNNLSVGEVLFYVQQNVCINGVIYYYVFGYCKWFIEHPCRTWYGSSAILSSSSTYTSSQFCFVPVQRLISKCAYGVMNVQFHNCNDIVSVAVPLDSKCNI